MLTSNERITFFIRFVPYRVHRRWAITVVLGFILTLMAAPIRASVEDNRWCRFSTSSLEIVTDMADSDATELVRALEQFRAQFSTTLFQVTADDLETERVAVRLVAFDRAKDFRRVFRTKRIVGLMRPSMSTHTLSFAVDPDYESAFHEFSHYLVRNTSELNIPSWYDEGLASYLATFFVETDETVEIGAVPFGRNVPTYRDVKRLPTLLSEPFPFEDTFRKVLNAYDLSWFLTHFLHHGDPAPENRHESIRRLITDLDQGRAPNDALTEHWGLDIDELVTALDRHRKSRLTVRIQPRVETTFEPIDRECLAVDDTRVMLAEIAAVHNPDRARRWLERTLDSNPDHLQALLGLSRLEPERAEELLAQAERTRPEHAAIQLRRAELALNECDEKISACMDSIIEAERWFRGALRAADRSDATADRNIPGIQVGAAYGLGVVYLLRNRPGNALGYLQAANRRVPWAPRPNFHLGIAYLDTGNEAKALHHLRKAALWDADPRWRGIAAKALERASGKP